LATVLKSIDKDNKIGCIVLTGGTRAFAGQFSFIHRMNIMILRILAGADIKEMQDNTMPQVLNTDFPDQLSAVSRIKKPIIAAVNGFAVHGSCLFKSIFKFLFVS
jgi:enoyl-CoA hydratase/carnithine racemase